MKGMPPGMWLLGRPGVVTEQAWMNRAACIGMDTNLFFPAKNDDGGIARAKAVCATCPVRAECLEYGLHAFGGIYGGKTDGARKKIRRSKGNHPANGRPDLKAVE